jgi:hypothetical protein
LTWKCNSHEIILAHFEMSLFGMEGTSKTLLETGDGNYIGY